MAAITVSSMRRGALQWLLAAALVFPQVVSAQDGREAAESIGLTAAQMFALGEQANAQGDWATAQALLEALLVDPDQAVRSEARFRLAMLARARGELRRAAVLLRTILDEEPGALRPRLELARVLEALGDAGGARQELRQAQAGPLPPEVARAVDRFAAALRETKPVGGSLEIALAPDSNVNRATRSDELTTVIGDFELDEDAQARSGIGLAVRAIGYVRHPLGGSVRLLGQLGLEGDLYRQGEFTDVSARIAFGPELEIGSTRLQVQGSYQRRWYGGETYADTYLLGVRLDRPLSRIEQLRLSGQVSRSEVVRNAQQDATAFLASGSYERALSRRAGVNLSLTALRQQARGPAFSSWYGQGGLFGWYQAGRATLFAGAAYSRLVADERIAIYPERRADRAINLIAGATLRQLTVSGFAPQVRLQWERNASSIQLYSFDRSRVELGIARAF